MKRLIKLVKPGLVVAVVAVVLVLVVLLTYFSSNLPGEANHFLALVGAGKMQEAYQETSVKYQGWHSFQQFQDYVKAESLDEFQNAAWGFSGVDMWSGYLIGTLDLRNHAAKQLQFEFVKQSDGWKVDDIKEPDTALMTGD